MKTVTKVPFQTHKWKFPPRFEPQDGDSPLQHSWQLSQASKGMAICTVAEPMEQKAQVTLFCIIHHLVRLKFGIIHSSSQKVKQC